MSFYIRARDASRLDFVVLSDHDIWVTQNEWATLTALADSFNDPGRFVTFLGIEWTHAYHMNVYFRGADGAFCNGEDGGPLCPKSQDFAAFYGPAVLAGEAGAHVNHPRWRVPWHEVDTAVTPNAEMFNHWWDRLWNRDGAYDNERGFGTLLWALQAGHRLGFVGASDYHGYVWNGPVGTGLTGCHVTNLTRDEVLDALRTRRCYATDGERIIVHFFVNGIAMGGQTTAPIGSAVTVTAVVSGTAVPTAIELVRNGVTVATKTDCTNAVCVFSAPLTISDEYTFIYARVRQPAGRRAWTSPVWVRGTCETAAACPIERYVDDNTNAAADECIYRWRVQNAASRVDRLVTCSDGDPACDSGSTRNECTFRVGVCGGVTTGHSNCPQAAVSELRLVRPSAAEADTSDADLENRLTLLTAMRALGPTSPPGGCSPYVDIRVPLSQSSTLGRGSRWLIGEGDSTGRRDRDTLRLHCLPPSG